MFQISVKFYKKLENRFVKQKGKHILLTLIPIIQFACPLHLLWCLCNNFISFQYSSSSESDSESLNAFSDDL